MSFPADPPVVELTTHPSPHPFVRRGLVRRRPAGLDGPGLVTMRAPDGTVVGDGIWNSRSDIALRRLTDGDVRFDAAALRTALRGAVERRRRHPSLAGAEAWRVVHAEGDGLSGLIVDRYRDVLVVELHSAGWVALLDPLLETLHELLGTSHHRVALHDRTARLEGVRPVRRTSEGCPKRLKLREHDVRYHVDLEQGHKTGFFCDQRDNRRKLAALVDGKDVADVCCYTGGFAVASQVLGAPASVTGVDLDEQALATARDNAKLNQVQLSLVHADAFDWMRQLGHGDRRFDVMVLDPPKFVPARSERTAGLGRYRDLNRLALELLRPGGLMLTCSCSGLVSRDDLLELLRTAARKARRSVRVLESGGAGPDHPVHLECPEGEYLKALWLAVDPLP